MFIPIRPTRSSEPFSDTTSAATERTLSSCFSRSAAENTEVLKEHCGTCGPVKSRFGIQDDVNWYCLKKGGKAALGRKRSHELTVLKLADDFRRNAAA